MSPLTRAAWFAAALVVSVPAVGRAQPTRIALSGITPAPGTGVFSSFDHAPSVSAGGVVAFRGLYPGGEGVYTGTGGTPTLIANSATPITGGGTYTIFGPPTITGSSAVFAGGQAVGAPPFIPFRGVYTSTVPGIVPVADLGTASPSGGGNFGGFAPPAVSGTTAVFFAGNPFAAGIYTRATNGTGAITKVADTTPSTSIPGVGGPFGNFLLPSISGTRVAFAGFGPLGGGVFTAATPGGPLTAVATTATPIPGGGGNFVGFGAPAVSGAVVAFAGGPTGGPGSSPTGIYANTGAGGSLVAVANTSTPVPGGPGQFTQFDPWVSLSGDDVLFVGHSSAGPGLYTNATGPLTRLVGAGSVFDGRTVADVEIGRQSFDGAFVTFWAGFTNGSSGIYVVPVPEPAGVLAVAAVAAGLLRFRRRRRRTGAADRPLASQT